MKHVTTHDHASATAEQVERAALERGVNADLGGRDTELECAKYKRVMQLEAEVQAWQGQHRAAKVQIDELKTELECSRIDLRKKQEWIDNQDAARNQLQKELQTMTASWKAVSVERDTLQKQLDHGQVKFNELWAAHKDWTQDEAEMREQIETLSKRLTEAKTHCTRLEKDSNYARSIAWACGAALVMLVVLMAATAAKGGVL